MATTARRTVGSRRRIWNSLLPLLVDGKPLGNRQLMWNGQAMRDGNWKLMIDGKGAAGVGLYNLADDIGEEIDVSKSHPDRVKSMQSALEAWKLDMEKTATAQPSKPAN